MNQIRKTVLVLLAVSTALMAAFVGYDRMTRDTEAPVIRCPETVLEASVAVTEQELLAEVTARDNRTEQITVVVEQLSPVNRAHQRTVTYAAADAAGNVGRAERTLHYTDYQPPEFFMDHAPRATRNEGIAGVIGGIRAQDGTGADLTARIRFDTLDGKPAAEEGMHLLEMRVTDAFGYNEVLEIGVELYDGADERIGVTLKQYLLYLPRNAAFDPQSFFESSTIPGTLTVDSDVNPAEPGVYSVTYTVTGETGETVGRSRMIVVVQP